ncbi:unnamed protein product [Litomosoides sigmodontis]|uniref:Sushi domain-containing protein n=1 Tax=Litomosoides sigmodontis TaxID=42156 RepID=A0A3P7LZT3_LITSI|nr:unnamed protein product [Litomosoides sigmodontis]
MQRRDELLLRPVSATVFTHRFYEGCVSNVCNDDALSVSHCDALTDDLKGDTITDSERWRNDLYRLIKMILHVVLTYVLTANVVAPFEEKCAFFHRNIAPCPPPKLPIPYIAYNPELINVNNIKYPHGTVAMLVCPTDYYLEVEGSRWRVCRNGVWNGPFGKCKRLGT